MHDKTRESAAARAEKRKELVVQYDIGGINDPSGTMPSEPFATVRELPREGKGRVVWVETNVGGHTNIVRFETTIDWVGRVAGIV